MKQILEIISFKKEKVHFGPQFWGFNAFEPVGEAKWECVGRRLPTSCLGKQRQRENEEALGS
jgi:hypothetical protein